MAAPRTLWLALVGLYEATATLVLGNLAWIITNFPLFLVVSAVLLPFSGNVTDASGPEWVLLLVAWLLLFLPSPASVALAALAAVAAGPDVPHIRIFWSTLRERWRLGLVCFAISLFIAVALLANVYFYFVLGTGVLRYVAIVWLYAALFWFSMHVYVPQLLAHVAEPRVLDIYRRAALIALGHPVFTVLVLVEILILGTLALIFLPAYLLVGPAYLSMIEAHAFREIRRRHGDLEPEPEDEVRL
jgi:uncharacterized membrane protein YesL